VRTPEWIAAAYFTYLLAGGLGLLQPGPRRTRLVAWCAALLAVIFLFAASGSSPVLRTCRDWLPGAYLIIGYWLSGLFFIQPDLVWESRLAAVDRAVFDWLRLDVFLRRAPRVLLELFELAYLCVYPLVPAGLVVLYVAGLRGQADLFWTGVLIATYLAYGTLPWITTRPPRSIETAAAIDRRRLSVRRLNLRVLDRASIQINTFPSGHAAGAVATALMVGWHLPWAGAVIGAISVGIIAGSVLGRYHYALDAVLGVLAALAGVAAAAMSLDR
jgi:hypothetical protein